MTRGKLGAALAALSLAVGCSPARVEVLIEPQPREVVRISTEVFGGGERSSVSLDQPPPGTGLRLTLSVTPGEGVVTVRSFDAEGNVVLEGRRGFTAKASAVAVCPVALRGAAVVSDGLAPRVR